MKKKISRSLDLTRETLRTLDENPLRDLVQGASLQCSTISRQECSGCDTCGPENTRP
jgi:hypothetical protein